jgi:hypothetical protein
MSDDLPIVMGLDLGSRTGFAVGRPGHAPKVGAYKFHETNDESWHAGAKLGVRLRGLFESEYKPKLVVIERPYITGQKNEKVIGIMLGLVSVTIAECVHQGIQFAVKPSQTVSKWALGKGRWTKDEGGRLEKKLQTQKWAYELGLVDEDSAVDADVCDACMLWYYGCHEILKFPEAELQMFNTMAILK